MNREQYVKYGLKKKKEGENVKRLITITIRGQDK